MIDYDLYKSEISDALEKNGCINSYHGSKIIVGAIRSICEKSTKEKTEALLDKSLYLIENHNLTPQDLITVFLEKMGEHNG